MSSGKVILGIIAGVSIGAMAGILLAPDKGVATRKKIVDHTHDLGTLLNYWATDFIESLQRAEEPVAAKEFAAALPAGNAL
jgi:gas vesicle protein